MVTMKKLTIFGNPLEHSFSPKLQVFFAGLCGDEIEYGRTLVPPGGFKACADEFFKQQHGYGSNVTLPCKLDACAYADELSPWAKAAGAVNTLLQRPDGSIYGDNTDGRGLAADLKRLGCTVSGARVLIIGAGGAAQGIILPLLHEKPASLTLVNRTEAKAFRIAASYGEQVKVGLFSQLRPEYDFIINAASTSLQQLLPPVADAVLSAATVAYDLMYSDQPTIFMRKARELGVKQVYDGFGMLIMQGMFSYELWTGHLPDAEAAIAHFRAGH